MLKAQVFRQFKVTPSAPQPTSDAVSPCYFYRLEIALDTLIVYLDDPGYAQLILAPLLSIDSPRRWVLVACAPRMSRRIGKWLSHSSRENWRAKWCNKLFTQITPVFEALSTKEPLIMEYVVADGPLPELTQQIRSRFGAASVIDARKPKFEQEVTATQDNPPHNAAVWQITQATG